MFENVQTNIIEQREGQRPRNNVNPNHPANPGAEIFAVLSSMFGGNGRHGDTVFSDEALDRVITQLMEQNNPNSAPGPASAAAIAALPKEKINKSMLGSDGKAECSVCMDAVDVGEEVTMLPCKHWFHEDCVGAWLKEHDTCPHCRQGIMPKDAPEDNAAPRSPNQAPRNFRVAFGSPSPPVSSPPIVQPGLYNQPPPPPGAFPTPHFSQGPIPQAGFMQPGLHHQNPGFHGWPGPPHFVAPNMPPNSTFPNGPFAQVPSPHPAHPMPPNIPIHPHQHQQQLTSPAIEFARLRQRSGARERRSHSDSGDNSSSSHSGGVTGWFRNLRGAGGSDHR